MYGLIRVVSMKTRIVGVAVSHRFYASEAVVVGVVDHA